MTTGFWKCLKIYETDVFEPAILLISLYVKFYSDGLLKTKTTKTIFIKIASIPNVTKRSRLDSTSFLMR